MCRDRPKACPLRREKMGQEDKGNLENEKEFESCRGHRNDKISRLSSFKDGYSVDKFVDDLARYFEGEVDFNLEKIREFVRAPGKLDSLIAQAEEKNTHPVTEFIQELFKDLYSQD